MQCLCGVFVILNRNAQTHKQCLDLSIIFSLTDSLSRALIHKLWQTPLLFHSDTHTHTHTHTHTRALLHAVYGESCVSHLLSSAVLKKVPSVCLPPPLFPSLSLPPSLFSLPFTLPPTSLPVPPSPSPCLDLLPLPCLSLHPHLSTPLLFRMEAPEGAGAPSRRTSR